jgi:hypothetical protein
LVAKLPAGQIEVEVSYTSYDLVYAITGLASTVAAMGGFITDPKLQPTQQYPLPVEMIQANPDMSLNITEGTLTNGGTPVDPFTQVYLQDGQIPPNAGIFGIGLGSVSPSQMTTFANNVNAMGLQQVATGAGVQFYLNQFSYNPGAGLLALEQNAAALKQDSGGVFQSWEYIYWDYYDVGAPFAANLVGYDMTDHYRSVLSYLQNTYQVNQVLREVKKYEAPLSLNTSVIGHGQLQVNWTGSCSKGYEHDLSPLTINNLQSLSEYYINGAQGFWLNGTTWFPSKRSMATLCLATEIRIAQPKPV